MRFRNWINRSSRELCLCGLLVTLLPVVRARASCALARTLSGGEFQHVVVKGDSFARMGSRFGVEPSVLARANGLETGAHLKPGSTVLVDNRHVVPDQIDDGILIDTPQRMLFFLAGGAVTAAYPAALGQPWWRTPLGDFTVVEMTTNPIWSVPVSIQRDMARRGKAVRTRVLAGPRNPLGKRWIGLSLPNIGIHGTITPFSIYHFRSHGCIRPGDDNVVALFLTVKIVTPGTIIYAPVLLAQLDDGWIFVEANPDIDGLDPEPLEDLRALAASSDIGHLIDWPRVKDALERKRRSGPRSNDREGGSRPRRRLGCHVASHCEPQTNDIP
jgi:L,D-transpeptidase ErfK/SrfK